MTLKIAVAGEIRSGKDSFCDYVVKNSRALCNGRHMHKLYFAEGIKEIIETYFPEVIEEGTKPRKHYQDIGQFMRSLDEDVWVKYLAAEYRTLSHFYINFIVTDLRQNNEYEWLKANGFTVVKVEASEEIRKQRMIDAGDVFTEESLNHPVEMSIRSLPYDYLVTNNGSLEELYQQADFILEELKGEV